MTVYNINTSEHCCYRILFFFFFWLKQGLSESAHFSIIQKEVFSYYPS